MYDDGGEERGEPGDLRSPSADRQDQARCHPLRLAILAILASGRTLAASEIADELPRTPGLALLRYHLGVLRRANLVDEKAEGTRRIFSLI